ncbi:hypothetical protein [Paeniglutamicibacter gangotriensis]|uniref:Uncharacterized protein n=1 Tax=Paeniglutamicibacter gangotriensis Lz1y TaxID=1276920 RepID=M7N500_9MICC|nr:hypothetical protein [Paeniglutamicibacter gangotriensis]EMQ96829.1 hypothetical protein ADIAG_03966 [Paeniglutamicibacter gangotriensis Lz1y]
MILFLAAGILCLALLLQLVVHPVQSVAALARMLCAVFGLILLLTAVGRFWNHDYLEAAAWILPAAFLLWCTNKLSRQVA